MSTLNPRRSSFSANVLLAPSNSFETAVVLTESIFCIKRKMKESSSIAVVCGIAQQPFIFNLATHERGHKACFLWTSCSIWICVQKPSMVHVTCETGTKPTPKQRMDQTSRRSKLNRRRSNFCCKQNACWRQHKDSHTQRSLSHRNVDH